LVGPGFMKKWMPFAIVSPYVGKLAVPEVLVKKEGRAQWPCQPLLRFF
jgi:hypothetical protein